MAHPNINAPHPMPVFPPNMLYQQPPNMSVKSIWKIKVEQNLSQKP